MSHRKLHHPSHLVHTSHTGQQEAKEPAFDLPAASLADQKNPVPDQDPDTPKSTAPDSAQNPNDSAQSAGAESIEAAEQAISSLGNDHPHPAPNETPETHIAFSLAWMTEDAHYNLKALHKMKGNDAAILESLFEFLETMSRNPWSYTKRRDKYDGGWEEMPLVQMNPAIMDGVPDSIAQTIEQVMVFRFNKSKDRLVALKQGSVLYLLGFDLHFNLYDHGS